MEKKTNKKNSSLNFWPGGPRFPPGPLLSSFFPASAQLLELAQPLPSLLPDFPALACWPADRPSHTPPLPSSAPAHRSAARSARPAPHRTRSPFNAAPTPAAPRPSWRPDPLSAARPSSPHEPSALPLQPGPACQPPALPSSPFPFFFPVLSFLYPPMEHAKTTSRQVTAPARKTPIS